MAVTSITFSAKHSMVPVCVVMEAEAARECQYRKFRSDVFPASGSRSGDAVVQCSSMHAIVPSL